VKKFVFAALALGLVLSMAAPSAAGSGISQISIDNQTKDAWVWVTAYEKVPFTRSIRKAWCVAPESRSQERIGSVIDEVRAEVTARNCAHPVYLDSILDTKGGKNSGGNLVVRSYFVRGSAGRYAFIKNSDQ
jgi:hypothetical protein